MTFLPIKYKSKRNETTKTNVLHKLISIRKKEHLESCTFLIKLTSTFKLLTQALRIFLNNSRLGVDGDEIYTIWFNTSAVERITPSEDNVHD